MIERWKEVLNNLKNEDVPYYLILDLLLIYLIIYSIIYFYNKIIKKGEKE